MLPSVRILKIVLLKLEQNTFRNLNDETKKCKFPRVTFEYGVTSITVDFDLNSTLIWILKFGGCWSDNCCAAATTTALTLTAATAACLVGWLVGWLTTTHSLQTQPMLLGCFDIVISR